MFNDDLQTAEYTDAGCCDCSGDVELPTWEETPTWDEPTWIETTTGDEPTTWDEPMTWTEEPAATAAPTEVGAAWGEGVETAAPTEYPSVAYIGGTDPWYQGAIELPTVATIGGNDPYQPDFDYPTVATIGGNNPYQPAFDNPTVAYVGGPNPWSAAAIDVANDTEAFSKLTLPEMKAELWGGTPELWDTPTVPLFGDTPIHTVIHGMQTRDALAALARNGVVIPFV